MIYMYMQYANVVYIRGVIKIRGKRVTFLLFEYQTKCTSTYRCAGVRDVTLPWQRVHKHLTSKFHSFMSNHFLNDCIF